MRTRVLGLVMAAAVLAGCGGEPESSSADAGWQAGAASRSVLPTVNGTHAYADPGVLPLDIDPYTPGVFVAEFDQGPIHVGNGNPDAHWVRDDLRVRALALRRGEDAPVVVVVTTDLYMVFAADAEALRERVREGLPEALRDHVEVLVTATHNHHGPDTAFHVNPVWYDHMLVQARDAVISAVERLEPATLRAAEGVHYFGASDLNGLRVFDPTLGVLQARAADGRVLATLVQWANHPESTLNWSPPRDAIAAGCGRLGWTGDGCSAAGRYLTADFPGALARTLGARIGGEVLYVNGAIGAMASPLGVPTWEIDERHPVGDGYTPPDGARPPGGDGDDYGVRNFRKAVLIGRELARASEALLGEATPLAPSRLEVSHEPFFTRMSNIGFRKLAVVDAETGRSSLGYRGGALFSCPAGGPKNAETCHDDGRAVEEDAVVGTVRAGDHTRSAVTLVRIDELSLVLLPGEVPGELVIGFPAAMATRPERWQDEAPALHTPVSAMTIPGYVKRLVPGRFRWAAGLGNDELGYILPLADYRVKCVADQTVGPGSCARLHAAGVIEHPDAVAGATCKALADRVASEAADPAVADGGVHPAVLASCRYGQALGEAAGHYEETNSVGWDAAQDMLDAVSRLTGVRDATMVNDGFAGHWHRYPRP